MWSYKFLTGNNPCPASCAGIVAPRVWCGWLSLLKWHIFHSCSTSCPSRPPSAFSLSWLPANQPPACTVAWCCYFRAAGLFLLKFHASVIQFLQFVCVSLKDSSLTPQCRTLPIYKITGSNVMGEKIASLMILYKLRKSRTDSSVIFILLLENSLCCCPSQGSWCPYFSRQNQRMMQFTEEA